MWKNHRASVKSVKRATIDFECADLITGKKKSTA